MSQLNASMPMPTSGTVLGQPRLWLGFEGASVLFLATAVYAINGYPWLMYLILFFAADVSIFGYLAGPRVGAICYNALHNYAFPIAALAACHIAGFSLAIPTIWIAHVAFDRMIGYGLKYDAGFTFTHLGRRDPLGKKASATS
jgi:hypothetical protein